MNVTGLPVATPEPYITRKQLAQRMACSESTIRRFQEAGMPHVKWGTRTVRYLASTAIPWALEHQGEKLAA